MEGMSVAASGVLELLEENDDSNAMLELSASYDRIDSTAPAGDRSCTRTHARTPLRGSQASRPEEVEVGALSGGQVKHVIGHTSKP